MMEENEVVVEAFTELAPRYERVVDNELHKFWGWSYQGFIQFLIEHTPINDGELILDIATGTGVIPRAVMQTNPNCKIIGIDITQAMLSHGKQKMGNWVVWQKSFSNHRQCYAYALFIFLFRSGLVWISNPSYAGRSIDFRNLPNIKGWRKVFFGRCRWVKIMEKSNHKLLHKNSCLSLFSVLPKIKTVPKAEASAVSNVFTAEDWKKILSDGGFTEIEITLLKSKKFWVPDPLLIQAIKIQEPKEKVNDDY